MDVILLVLEAGQVEVEDDRHLLNVNAAGYQVRGNENAGGTGAEIGHALLADRLGHGFAVNHGDGETALRQRGVQTLRSISRVHEDDRGLNRDALEDIAEGVELPAVVLDLNDVLLDTVKLDIGRLEGHADGILEDLFGELLDLGGHGGREEGDAAGLREADLDNLTHLIGKSVTEHLVSLIEDEAAEIVEAEVAAVGQIVDATGSADDNVGAGADLTGILVTGNAADRENDLDLQVAADRANHSGDLLGELMGVGHHEGLGLLQSGVNTAQNADAEGAGLAGTGLGLAEYITSLDEGHDGNGLDRGGLLEAVGVDSAEEVFIESHLVKGLTGRELGYIGGFNFKLCAHRTLASLVTCWRQVWHFGFEGFEVYYVASLNISPPLPELIRSRL